MADSYFSLLGRFLVLQPDYWQVLSFRISRAFVNEPIPRFIRSFRMLISSLPSLLFRKTAASNPVWALLGVACRDEWEMEAGQIIIDKKYHMDALLLSQRMLEDWQFWFNFSDGDKVRDPSLKAKRWTFGLLWPGRN